MSDEIPNLPLNKMHERHHGLTPALSECYLEAARVCLDRHHLPPEEFNFQFRNAEARAVVEWEPTDDRCKGAWANKDDATRDGAYAVAIASTEQFMELYAVRRAETLTGADYYIGSRDQSSDDFENLFRLEVSGTDSDYYEVQRSLRLKIRQAREGDSNLPAMAAVVGFRVKLVAMESLGEQA